MPIDASIYGLLKPPVQGPGPLEQFGQVENLRSLMGQRKLHELQTTKLEGDLAEETAGRDYLKNLAPGMSPTSDEAVSGLMRIAPTRALAMQKAGLETQKTRGEIDKTQQEMTLKAVAAHRDSIPQDGDPAAMADWMRRGYEDPRLAPILSKGGTLEQALARIPTDPAQMPAYIRQNALGATKFIEMNKPSVHVLNSGRTNDVIATPGLGGAPTTLSSTPIKVSEAQEQTDKRIKEEGDLNRKVTLRGQSLTDARARDRLAFDQSAPKGQIVQTDEGLMLADPRAGTAAPMTGPDGTVLQKPLKPLPPHVNDAIISNAQSLYTLDKAINLLGGKDVDSAKGDKAATGWKGYLPQSILNRIDSSGVDTRAEISDIGSLKIHDRSGAAVTVSESPRLMPFIPTATDPADVATRKLTRLKEEAQRMQQGLTETYSKDQGYKPNPLLTKAPAPKPKPALMADKVPGPEAPKSGLVTPGWKIEEVKPGG